MKSKRGWTGTIPKGLRPPAQGCEARATLGSHREKFATPTGLWRTWRDGGSELAASPLGLSSDELVRILIFDSIPRMNERADFYVYVYVDPRNFEEFYYGKGCGGRKESHLKEGGASEKTERIAAIRKEGLEPTIRVIAKGLTAAEALLVETTLIWKLGRNLTNQSAGHYSGHFRPQHTMHTKLPGFDFHNSIYYVNVSEGPQRSWDDCRRFGFVAAGHGRNWSEQLERLQPGDVVAAYQRQCGFLGVGIVRQRSVPVKRYRFNGKPLQRNKLAKPGLFENADDPERAQYLVAIDWQKTMPKPGHFRRNAGLYTPQRVVASLATQPVTRAFIEEVFEVSLDQLATGTGD